MEQYFQEVMTRLGTRERDVTSLEKCKSFSAGIEGPEVSSSGGFECNICLELVQDPVVTLCGHLYCWPCIYKWIHFQTASVDKIEQQNPQCPVCKADITERTLIPLYGRAQTTKPSDGKTPSLGIIIPRRPTGPSCGTHNFATSTATASLSPAQQLHHHTLPPHSPGYASMPIFGLERSREDPMLGMYGEMVYARIFGNSQALYTYPNSYHLVGSSSPRLRRHLLATDESLGRVCFFLFCCVVLCLLLF